MKKLKYSAFLALLAFSTLCFAPKSHAAFISPARIYIHDGQTTASLSITNNSPNPLVFTFEWERRVRSADGKDVRVLSEGETAEGYRPADPYLIYSPRKVVVEAGETQHLRILAQRPSNMPAGEYRSHLKIASDNAQPLENPPVGAGQFGGDFQIRHAVSIPVMLRTGTTVVDMKISGVKVDHEGNSDYANVDIVNNSTRSVYGTSHFKCQVPGAQEITAKSNGFRLYTETKTDSEKFAIPDEVALSKCSSLELDLLVSNEPEYANKPVAVVKLK